MTSNDQVDYYHVQTMIRDALDALRRSVGRDLDELREAVAAERVDRQDAIKSLQRTLDARTERFV